MITFTEILAKRNGDIAALMLGAAQLGERGYSVHGAYALMQQAPRAQRSRILRSYLHGGGHIHRRSLGTLTNVETIIRNGAWESWSQVPF